MRKILIVLALFISSVFAESQVAAIPGYCTLGASQAMLSGMISTNYQQGIVPFCTVTVYLTGTITPATIYSTSTLTPLPNPFTASNLGYWQFYASPSSGYDVVLSGGIAPNNYPAPVTLTDLSGLFSPSYIFSTVNNFTALQNFNAGLTASAITSKTDNGLHIANQWCTTPGTLDQSCIQNAINDIVANGPIGPSGRRMGVVYVPVGQYNIASTITIPGGTANIVLKGDEVSIWGSVLMATLGLGSSTILQVNADATTITGLAFEGPSPYASPCVTLGTSTSTTFDSGIFYNWFYGCGYGIHIVNYSGGIFYDNTFDAATSYGIISSTSIGDKEANNLRILNNRFFGNGLSIDLNGSGTVLTGVDPLFGVADIVGNEIDQSDNDSGSAVDINSFWHVNIVGNTFRQNIADDIDLGSSNNITVSGNTSASPGRDFLNANTVSGLNVTGNSIRNCNIGTYVGNTAAIFGVGLTNSTISGVVITADSGLNECSNSIYVDITSRGTSVGGNNIIVQQVSDYDILDPTSLFIIPSSLSVGKTITAGASVATSSGAGISVQNGTGIFTGFEETGSSGVVGQLPNSSVWYSQGSSGTNVWDYSAGVFGVYLANTFTKVIGCTVSGGCAFPDGLSIGAGLKISNSNLLPQVGTPTVGQAACIKSAGPPVVIGFCSTTPTSGTCTCN